MNSNSLLEQRAQQQNFEQAVKAEMIRLFPKLTKEAPRLLDDHVQQFLALYDAGTPARRIEYYKSLIFLEEKM